MRVDFVKMHGVGNDFMVVRWPAGAPSPSAELVRRWADRRRGVGFDQLMIVAAAVPGSGDAAYRVFNADGGEVEQCGNGARCVARFLAGDRPGTELALVSAGGPVAARVLDEGRVSVSLGEPDFTPSALPFEAPAGEASSYRLDSSRGELELGIVSVGNPHAVMLVDSVDQAPVGILGPELAGHPRFPKGVNVGFMQIVDPQQIRLRVHERGVGETPACGTGAAAAVAVGRRWERLGSEVRVGRPGGVLEVRWPGPGSVLWLTGPTTVVYEGQIEL